jgi:hypothetical protein
MCKSAQNLSSRLYGLRGEALLNFGPFGVAPIFGIYGALLGYYRRKLQGWHRLDARMLLAPFFTLMFVEALLCDSDVLVFFAATQGALISFFVFAASDALPPRTRGKRLPEERTYGPNERALPRD